VNFPRLCHSTGPSPVSICNLNGGETFVAFLCGKGRICNNYHYPESYNPSSRDEIKFFLPLFGLTFLMSGIHCPLLGSYTERSRCLRFLWAAVDNAITNNNNSNTNNNSEGLGPGFCRVFVTLSLHLLISPLCIAVHDILFSFSGPGHKFNNDDVVQKIVHHRILAYRVQERRYRIMDFGTVLFWTITKFGSKWLSS
jgi:hypothetical protein